MESSLMNQKERRKHPRVPTSNIVSYVCIDANGKPIAEGMGKTVDISQGGALLETGRPIESEYILMLSIDLEKKVVETKGRVAHSRSNGDSTYLTGIKFEGTPDEVTTVIRNLVIDYHRRRLKQ
jgi:c-di-GMP-binding flagellar brake protein YcgR